MKKKKNIDSNNHQLQINVVATAIIHLLTMQATTKIQPHPTAAQIQHLCRRHSGHRNQGNQLLSQPSLPQLQVVTPCHCRIQPCAASHVCIFLLQVVFYSIRIVPRPHTTNPDHAITSKFIITITISPLSDVLHNAASMTKGF